MAGSGTRDLPRWEQWKTTQEIDKEIVALLDGSPHPLVHLIINVSEVTVSVSLAETMSLQYPRHRKIGWNILVRVQSNAALRLFSSMAASIAKVRYRETNTLDSAFAILQERVPDLPDLKQAFQEMDLN